MVCDYFDFIFFQWTHFFVGASQPFYIGQSTRRKCLSGCVINRGVVLVDLEKWKSQNITGAIEDLVRLHLTKGHRGKNMENRCFFGQEIHHDLQLICWWPCWFAVILKNMNMETRSIYMFMNWVVQENYNPRGGFDRLDIWTIRITIGFQNCLPLILSAWLKMYRCLAAWDVIRAPAINKHLHHHFKFPSGTTRKVFFTIRRFRRNQQNHSPLWLYLNSIHPICKYLT